MPIDSIVIKRSDLLEKAEANLADYKELVQAAEKAYEEIYNQKKEELAAKVEEVGAECLAKQVEYLRSSAWSDEVKSEHWAQKVNDLVYNFKKFIQNEKPLNCIQEFEDAVGMLWLSCEETMAISREEYLNLCENRWDFVEDLVNSAATFYSGYYGGNVGIGTNSPSAGEGGVCGPCGSPGVAGKLGSALSKFRK